MIPNEKINHRSHMNTSTIGKPENAQSVFWIIIWEYFTNFTQYTSPRYKFEKRIFLSKNKHALFVRFY